MNGLAAWDPHDVFPIVNTLLLLVFGLMAGSVRGLRRDIGALGIDIRTLGERLAKLEGKMEEHAVLDDRRMGAYPRGN
jgi:hypothetical protein